MPETIPLNSESLATEWSPERGGRLVAVRLSAVHAPSPAAVPPATKGRTAVKPAAKSAGKSAVLAASTPAPVLLHPAVEVFSARSPAAPTGRGTPGFEDVFPCRRGGPFPLPAYSKNIVPELGDARDRRWQCEVRGPGLRFWMVDKRFGWKMERTVCFASADTLRLDYRLDNVSDDWLPFVWFGRLVLPTGVRTEWELPAGADWQGRTPAAVSTVPDSPGGPRAGGAAPVQRSPAAGAASMLPVHPYWLTTRPLRTLRAVWRDEGAGWSAGLRADADVVAHLGAETGPGWAALEPGTSPTELPGGARTRGAWLGPLQHVEWWLELSFRRA